MFEEVYQFQGNKIYGTGRHEDSSQFENR